MTGFGFSDNSRQVFTYPFDGLEIRGGETILFFRSNRVSAVNLNPVNTTNKFFAWWWAPNQTPALQVRFFVNPGLDGDVQDQVWLLDANSNVVDSVSFGRSTRGRSFTYDPDTGDFGSLSVPGDCGGFRAAGNTNDIGSPGVTCGPVPVSIAQPPASQTVDGCGTATFSVLARGLPRPKFQWYRDGVCMTGEIAATLIIPGVQPSDAGDYHVRLSNGLTNLDSAPAHLSVSTNPLAPAILRGPVDVTAFPGQTGVFSVQARGFPCLEYQWSSNGVALAGETNQTLRVPVPVAAPLGSTEYCVTVSNSSGATNACAHLLVVQRPCLCFTEIMSVPNDELALGHFGWFELTNCGTNEVNLLGYRYRDGPNLNETSTITNDIVLRPGQSAVFVEFMSAAAFRGWWGAERLPPDLPIITWGGWGLSGQGNDVIHLWNPAATDPYDPLATGSHIIASNGFSQELDRFYDPTFGCVSGFLQDSVAWENGAFPAEVGGDIGSPGYIVSGRKRVFLKKLTRRRPTSPASSATSRTNSAAMPRTTMCSRT